MGFLDLFSRLRKKHCAGCGQFAIHGYSRAPESRAKDITPLCVSCLDSQVLLDYRDFGGRAVLIAPASACFVTSSAIANLYDPSHPNRLDCTAS
jgi:hypothetical protein